ncbi:MAG: filamentous hemagglutinin family protein [Aquabacterium sp.]
MFVTLSSLIRRRPAHRQARRGSFTQRLMRWAGTRSASRWRFSPLAGAAAAVLMGQSALAAPGQFTLPEPLQGVRTIRGKTFTFQPTGQNSVLGPKVEFRDAQGQLQSVTMKLVQTSRSGIYNWSSFDIGSSATFEIDMQAGSGSSALNRVVGSTKLSEIHGKLKSNGNVFLINPNGVLFGKGAQVNVQGLVASTLDVSDEVFLNGLSTINTNNATFRWQDLSDDGLVTFDHPDNYVLVDKDATIITPSGGRVWLMARKVENRGTVSVEGGQAALLGGEAVYIKTPDQEPKLYASEVNANLPVLRGFLFEVDNATGEVNNLGQIMTERGNTTLMAHTVRHSGRIRATTTVQENGSVFLLARSGVQGNEAVRAQSAGSLTLEAGSRIDITPDNSQKASGSVQTTMSRIELNGQTIVMEGARDGLAGAQVKAPAANVNVRAEATPNYDTLGAANVAYQGTAAAEGRFVMGAGATIDVSGTTDTVDSVARHFVTTEFIRNGDLASNPFLKEGALLNTKVTYDTRSAPAVLEAATHQGYKDSIQTTAGERMAKGGQVNLVATGAVLMQEGSTVDVSGGQVRFTEAVVNPTRLLGADGQTYSVNTARTTVQVVAVSGKAQTDATRYGVVASPVASTARVEAGYTQGADGGRLVVHAPAMALDGQVRANVQQGERQRAGVDARAAQASVRLGLSTQGNLLQGLSVRVPGTPASTSTLWVDPLGAALPERSSVSAAWFNASGAGSLTVSSAGGIHIDDGAHLRLQRGGSLSLQAGGAEGIYLGGDITGAGASVSISTASLQVADPEAGGITLAQGRRIDVAGDVVNQRRDGASVGNAVAGGSVSLRSAAGVDLQSGTRIDVSGGATVLANNSIRGTRAGDISVVANTEAGARAGQFDAVNLGAELSGYTLAGTVVRAFNDVGDARTGKLTLRVGEIDIVGSSSSNVTAPDGLVLGSDFFNQGGFSQFDLDGVRRLTVHEGARIAPQVSRWLAQPSLLNAATGSVLATRVQAQVLPDTMSPVRSLAIRSSGYADNVSVASSDLNGALTLQAGGQIDAGARGAVTLSGGKSLMVDGSVKAAGGRITTELVGLDSTPAVDSRVQGTYRLGSTAVLDVSGTTLLSPNNLAGQRAGEVLGGGQITVQVPSSLGATTPIELREGAQLLANGAQSALDVQTLGAGGVVRTQRQTMASNGGQININVGAAGSSLAGTLQARAGADTAQGGTLQLSINDGGSTRWPTASLQVQQAAVTDAITPGALRVSADAIQEGGFARVVLSSTDEIAAVGDVRLAVAGDMTLDAPTLAVREGAQALWSAAGRLARTNTQLLAPAAATGGAGQITLQAGVLDISGTHTTQGAQQLNLKAREEIRFHALSAQRRQGQLDIGAQTVVLEAPQVNVATATDYTVSLSGDGVKRLTVQGGEASSPPPLSAGGRLTLKADDITIDGVVRAPFGQIQLQAPSVTLTSNALVSVSGDGLVVPYGSTADAGTRWLLNGQDVSAPPAKTITLDAGDGQVTVASGAQLDLSAGGQLVGWEFVPGPGGSRDVFNGTFESGTFAVVPSVKGLGGIDPDLLTLSGLNDSVLTTSASRQITFGEGGPVPAGTYTILPARYALLQGGFLIRQASTSIPLQVGQSQTLNTGAVRVGAQVGVLGQAMPAAPSATFEVLTREQALRFSEISTTTFDGLVNAQAERAGVEPARRAMDAGSLDLVARRVSLEGDLAYRRVQGGRGGELNIASDKVQVGGSAATASNDTLVLDVGQLNRTGVDSLLIGGRRSGQAADGSRRVEVSASEVVVVDGGEPLALADVILVGQDKVAVSEGAVVQAAVSAGNRQSADSLTVEGDGALVRVSADAQVATRRVGSDDQPITRERGDVVVADGAVLQGGSLVIEGTRSATLGRTAVLSAQALVLGADEVALGDGVVDMGVGDAPVLRVGNELLNQLSQVDRLTLRAFGGVSLAAGEDVAVRQALTLDTPVLRQADGAVNIIQAGALALNNSSGTPSVATSGTGTLVLHATGQNGQDGHVRFNDGVVATQGSGQVQVQAAGSVVLNSRREVSTAVVDQARPDGYAEAPDDNGAVRLSSRAVASGLQTQGDLTISAQSVTATDGAVGMLDAGQGGLTVLPSASGATGAVAAATSGLGAQISLQGAAITQGGTVQAGAGTVALRATSQEIRFTEGSRTDVDGTAWTVDGVKVPIAAGLIKAQADAGDVTVALGAVLSASAAAGVAGAEAGEVRLVAQQGEVRLDGEVRLLSDAGQRGGSLQIDARTAPSLDDLAARLLASAAQAAQAQGSTQARHNATQSLSVHQRDGQNMVLSAGQTLRAQQVQLVADRVPEQTEGGHIHILGQVDASGVQGGEIRLSAEGDVVLGDGQGAAGSALLNTSASGAQQDGGEIHLASREGVVRLQADGLVNMQGGTDADGGTLTLRAGVRDADQADPDTGVGNVKVAAIEAQLQGVSQLTVQGEERVEVGALGAAELTALKNRSLAFQATARSLDTLNKVLNGRTVDGVARIQSAQVLESNDDLTLNTAWNLTALNRRQVGSQFVVELNNDTPLDLSIRTAGHLNLVGSISGGFINAPLTGTAQSSAASNTTLNNALRVAPADLPVGEGSSINLVAGADLNSAHLLATQASGDGSVRIGNPDGSTRVFVRSTTGDIQVAAAGDIVLENDRATVYTTGRLPTAGEVEGALGFGTGNPTSAALHRDLITRGTGVNTTRQLPFMLDGGSIGLRAGGSVRTDVITTPSFVSDWTFHKSDRSASKSQAWWSRYDLFDMGVATFGGGDIRASAGADVLNTGFVTATSAYRDADGAVHRFGGGDVQVQADGNLTGLMVKVGGHQARIAAGQNIDGSAERGAASLMYESTNMTVRAAQDMLVDLITEAGLHEKGSGSNDASRSFGIAGLGRDASLSLIAVSGELRMNDVLQPGVDTTHAAATLLPSDTLIAAPMGSIVASRLNQMPQAQGALLSVLAGENLRVGSVNVAARSLYGDGLVWVGNNEPVVGFLNGVDANGTFVIAGLAEGGRREPIRLVAQQGDVSLRAEVADSARIIAGGDVNMPRFLSQHQEGYQLTLIQAGRDVNLVTQDGRAVVRGPGDLLVMAGRDVNLGLPGGLETNGNRENGALPEGSAKATILAGVKADGLDHALAQSRYFHLLGGAGVANRPADLYAQLVAVQAGQALPALGSEQAQTFSALPFSAQLQQARALVGEAAYQQALLTYMQGREGQPGLSMAAALALLDRLPQREQTSLLGQVLAPSWQQALSSSQQRDVAVAMAAQGDQAEQAGRLKALSTYVQQRTGQAPQDQVAALEQFEQLGQEHRWLFTHQVLQSELTASGVNAAQQTSGEAKLDAYQRGMDALATVFPGSKPLSSLVMGSSSIKTQQGSDIAIFTPHGGMNVGRLTGAADSTAAASLGIVTTSGGGITGVVRDSIEVNQSRIFVVQEGDMLLWASLGNIDAGKGSKTVTGAPAPVFRIVNGQLQVDTTGSFSGSGIATLDATSNLYLFARQGEINAGEAGIKTSGNLTIDAPVIVGGNDIQIAGGGNLAPPPVVGNAATSLGDLGQSATAAGPAQAGESERASGTPRRRLLLDFLGFGADQADQDDEDDKKKSQAG